MRVVHIDYHGIGAVSEGRHETNAMKRGDDQPNRSDLRIADLKARKPGVSTVMNIKVPSHVANASAEMAHTLNTSKQRVMVALLDEGLAAARTKARR